MAGSISYVVAAALLLLSVVDGASRLQALAQTSPDDFLQPQNAARAEVGVGKLTWDATVAAYAHRYAEKRSHDCAMAHSRGPYGENIYRGSAGGGPRAVVADAVAFWLEEREYYDCESNRCARRRSCLHYTQVVWAATKRVGCAAVECRGGDTFVVCSYDPPGNMDGEAPYPACGRYRVAAV